MSDIVNVRKTIVLLINADDSRAITNILEAKRLGYRTVLLSDSDYDYSQERADVLYVVDYKDIDRVTEIARNERADAIVGLSDKTVIAAAHAAGELGLIGNTVASMQTLLSKDSFRNLQDRLGLFAPRHIVLNADHSFVNDAVETVLGSREWKEFIEKLSCWDKPILLKPVLGASSCGQCRLDCRADGRCRVESRAEREVLQAIRSAADCSRDKSVILEEYIETREALRIIEGEIFLLNGEFLWDGIHYSDRLPDFPLKPVYDSYPVELSDRELELIKSAVSRAILGAGACFGEFNFEGAFTSTGEFFVFEINPRQGGHYNPIQVQLSTGVNFTCLLQTTAARDMSYYEELKSFERSRNNIVSLSVFSDEVGYYDHFEICDKYIPMLVQNEMLQCRPGDKVFRRDVAERPLAKLSFKFEDKSEMEEFCKNITQIVKVELR